VLSRPCADSFFSQEKREGKLERKRERKKKKEREKKKKEKEKETEIDCKRNN
jgi:hypothetical protein